jgi:hypothetical protein
MPMECEYIVVHDDAVHITHNQLLILCTCKSAMTVFIRAEFANREKYPPFLDIKASRANNHSLSMYRVGVYCKTLKKM